MVILVTTNTDCTDCKKGTKNRSKTNLCKSSTLAAAGSNYKLVKMREAEHKNSQKISNKGRWHKATS